MNEARDIPEPRTAFVISPIGSSGTPEHRRYKLTLDYIVKKALTAPEWVVIRADEEDSPDSIPTKVIQRIVESHLVIADMSDRNPNVFYELAVAHGYEKRVVYLMVEGQTPPFDIADQRMIYYDLTNPESVDLAIRNIRKAVKWLEMNAGDVQNPLTAYGQFSVIRKGSSENDAGQAVAEALSALSVQVHRLDRRFTNETRNRRLPEPDRGRLADAKRAHLIMSELSSLDRRIDELHARAHDAAMDEELESLTERRDTLRVRYVEAQHGG